MTPRLQTFYPSERRNGLLSNGSDLLFSSSSMARGRFNARSICMTAYHSDTYYGLISLLLKLEIGPKQQSKEAPLDKCKKDESKKRLHAFAAVMVTVTEQRLGLMSLGGTAGPDLHQHRLTAASGSRWSPARPLSYFHLLLIKSERLLVSRRQIARVPTDMIIKMTTRRLNVF